MEDVVLPDLPEQTRYLHSLTLGDGEAAPLHSALVSDAILASVITVPLATSTVGDLNMTVICLRWPGGVHFRLFEFVVLFDFVTEVELSGRHLAPSFI